MGLSQDFYYMIVMDKIIHNISHNIITISIANKLRFQFILKFMLCFLANKLYIKYNHCGS